MTLAEAAGRLGCHVETLRLRVRSGELAARRGPHGRYLVPEPALAAVSVSKHRPGVISEADFAEAWESFLQRVAATRATPAQLVMIAGLRDAPPIGKRLHRLLAVQALSVAGYSSTETAGWLRITPRHVRRLKSMPIEVVVFRVNPWRPPSRREAAEIVAGIQRAMADAGFRGHLTDPYGTRRRERQTNPAFRSRLSESERRRLSHLGFTFRETEAMNIVRLGADELNYLLLHGRPDEGSAT